MSGSRKVADMTAAEYSEMIAAALGGRNSSSSSSSSSASSSSPRAGSGGLQLDDAVSKAVGGIFSLGKEGTATSKIVQTFGSVLGMASKTVGTVFTGMTDAGKELAVGYQTQLKNGVAFSEGFMGYAKDAAAAGLSVKEYEQRRAETVLNLAGQSGEAMKKITELTDGFKKTDLGKDLMRTQGLTSEMMERYTLSYVNSMNNLDLSDEKSKKAAIANMEKYVERVQIQSQAVGISTDAVNKQTAAMNESLQVQMMRLEGDEATNEGISALIPQLTGMGPALQNLANEAASSLGVTGPKAAMTEGALGAQGYEFSAAIKELKEVTERGGSAQEKAMAEQRVLLAKNDIDALLRSPQFIRMAEAERRDPSQTGTGGALVELMKERMPNLQRDKAVETMLARNQLPTDIGTVKDFQRTTAARATAGVDENGQPRAGDASLAAVQQANMLAKDKLLNLEVIALEKLVPQLDKMATSTTAINALNQNGQRITSSDIVGTNGRPSLSQQQQANTPRVPTLYPERRNTGTEGEIKEKLEPKDVIAQLHKGEKVLKPDDAMKFESMGGLDFLKSMTGGKMPAGMPKDMLGGMDPSKMFGDMQQQMAPMMGDMQKQMTPMMGEMKNAFSNIKMPSGFDTSKITSMLGNIKQPDMGQLANMAKSMIPPTDGSAAAMSKDMMSNLKSTVSSITQQPNVSEPAKNEYDDEGTTPTVASPTAAPTDSINSDILNALNNLNKLTAQSLDALVRTAGHAEKTAGGIDGMNANRFG